METPERIKAMRKRKKLSQSNLAEMTGLSLMSIRRYENGEREPKMSDLKKIADALNRDIAYLLPYPQTPGCQIRRLREDLGLSIKEFAEKADIPLKRLSDYENNLEVISKEDTITIKYLIDLHDEQIEKMQDERFNKITAAFSPDISNNVPSAQIKSTKLMLDILGSVIREIKKGRIELTDDVLINIEHFQQLSDEELAKMFSNGKDEYDLVLIYLFIMGRFKPDGYAKKDK